MRFENTQVFNFEGALRGMRNPKNSWHKSDSYFGIISEDDKYNNSVVNVIDAWVNQDLKYNEEKTYNYVDNWEQRNAWLRQNGILKWNYTNKWNIAEIAFIGPNDMKLAQTLITAGPEHRKFLRQIFVSVDITAPVYFWKELDTYKVATVANSTSSMHTLISEPITIDKFELDDYIEVRLKDESPIVDCTFHNHIDSTIKFLEKLRLKYIETKDQKYWKELIRWLPSSWLQKRTWTCNYETLLAICSPGQRRYHKLNEWSGIHTPVEQSFIQWARTLPYAQDFIFIDEQVKQE